MATATIQTIDIKVRKSDGMGVKVLQVSGYPVSLPHGIEGIAHRMHSNENWWSVSEVTTGMAIHQSAKSKVEAIKKATERLNNLKNPEMVIHQIKHMQANIAKIEEKQAAPVATPPPSTGTEVEPQDKHDEQVTAQLLSDLNDYDVVIIAESGGKDSVACALYMLDQGVDPAKIELWHQCIDDGEAFMDWTCTESYVQALGDLLGINVFFQWREGGFKGELFRKDSIKGGVYYYSPGGGIEYLPSKEQPPTSRLMFPQLGFDLSKRWCSGELKIDVAKRVIANDERYQGTLDNPKKILYISGERREESAFRAKYEQVQLHSTNCKSRTVHHWRPVIDFKERDIWDMYEKRRLRPHPAYSLGWSRTSCFGCIFSTPDLWAMMREIAPERFNRIVEAEIELNHTIQSKRVKGQTVGISIVDLANKGSLDRLPKGNQLSRLVYEALNEGFRFTAKDLIMDKWELPAGAFKGNEGGSL